MATTLSYFSNLFPNLFILLSFFFKLGIELWIHTIFFLMSNFSIYFEAPASKSTITSIFPISFNIFCIFLYITLFSFSIIKLYINLYIIFFFFSLYFSVSLINFSGLRKKYGISLGISFSNIFSFPQSSSITR